MSIDGDPTLPEVVAVQPGGDMPAGDDPGQMEATPDGGSFLRAPVPPTSGHLIPRWVFSGSAAAGTP